MGEWLILDSCLSPNIEQLSWPTHPPTHSAFNENHKKRHIQSEDCKWGKHVERPQTTLRCIKHCETCANISGCDTAMQLLVKNFWFAIKQGGIFGIFHPGAKNQFHSDELKMGSQRHQKNLFSSDWPSVEIQKVFIFRWHPPVELKSSFIGAAGPGGALEHCIGAILWQGELLTHCSARFSQFAQICNKFWHGGVLTCSPASIRICICICFCICIIFTISWLGEDLTRYYALSA